MKKNEVKNLIKEIIAEAEQGRVVIDTTNNSMIYPIRFFISINGVGNVKNSQCPTILINNETDFFNNLTKYLEKAEQFYKEDQTYFMLSDRDYAKFLITTLILNAGKGDFNNFDSYVKLRTKQLEESVKIGTKKHYDNGQYTLCSKTEKLKPNLEGQYKITYYLDAKENGQYIFPSVTFGLADNSVYVYAVQGMKGKQSGKFASKVDRTLRKINKGVEAEDYIMNVSPSAVASFCMFLEQCKQKQYDRVEGVTYMPLRYQAKHNEINIKGNRKGENSEIVTTKQIMQDEIQYNITNKLGLLFPRAAHHFPSYNVSFDYETETVDISLNNKKSKNGENIIYQIIELV